MRVKLTFKGPKNDSRGGYKNSVEFNLILPFDSVGSTKHSTFFQGHPPDPSLVPLIDCDWPSLTL
jgi:hypothetical protein